jgi:hypothetical protein
VPTDDEIAASEPFAALYEAFIKHPTPAGKVRAAHDRAAEDATTRAESMASAHRVDPANA